MKLRIFGWCRRLTGLWPLIIPYCENGTIVVDERYLLQLLHQEVFRVILDPEGQRAHYKAFPLDISIARRLNGEALASHFLRKMAAAEPSCPHIYAALGSSLATALGSDAAVARYLVIKFPFLHEIEWTALRQCFPQSRFLHIVRHPVRRYQSVRTIYQQRHQFLDWHRACENWVGSTMLAFLNAQADGAGYRIVRYEDTMGPAAEATMRGIAEWLDIEFDGSLLAATVGGVSRERNSSFYSRSKAKQGEFSEPSQLSAHEQALVAFLCHEPGARLRYNLPSTDPLLRSSWRPFSGEGVRDYLRRRRFIRRLLVTYGGIEQATAPVAQELFSGFRRRVETGTLADVLSY